MIRPKKPNGYWTKENCTAEALKYNSRSEFQKGCSSAYTISLRNKWIDIICSHMKIKGNKIKRCIYSYEFSDNNVYVGLTYDIEKRHVDRLNNVNDSVTKYINETGLSPIRKQLTDYIDVEEAIKMEEYFLNKYIKEGWVSLNKVKTGSIGGNNLKWTKEKCNEVALKFRYKKDFTKNKKTVYNISHKNGWLDDICTHMVRPHTSNANGWTELKWSKENCIVEALKYTTRRDMELNSPSAYVTINKNKWGNELFSHMNRQQKVKDFWTKEECHKEALKYNSRSEFQEKCISGYIKARKNKWLNSICSHMELLHKPNGYWTKKRCQEEALKYNSRSELHTNNSVVYTKSRKNKWLDDFYPKK